MLHRKFLDDKCSGNDPGRVRDIKKCPTEMANIVEPKTEFCEQQNLVNQPEVSYEYLIFSRIYYSSCIPLIKI